MCLNYKESLHSRPDDEFKKQKESIEEGNSDVVVDNYLNIYGQPSMLKSFYSESAYCSKGLSFDAYIKTPLGLTGEEILIWRLDNWGVCYDIEDTDLIILNNQSHIYYEFATVGKAPTTWIKRMVIRYPEIEFELRYQSPENSYQNVIRGKKCHIFQL